MEIKKSKGFTLGEQKVAQICENSFLSLWSYPNLFYSPNKELCDVLIVFGDFVLIISEKTSKFNTDTADIAVEWGRYKRRIIDKSYRQLRGAENWLKRFPDRLFLDAACTQPFPLHIRKDARFIKISVINGLDEINQMRDNAAEDSGVFLPPDMQIFDMAVNEYVHLLDDRTFPILFSELDTALDLISYFVKKEELIQSGKMLFVPPENDLLVTFLSNFDASNGEHCFVPCEQSVDMIVIDNPTDPYEKYVRQESVKRKKIANLCSYMWDNIIERYNRSILEDQTIDNMNFAEKVKIAEILASENRYHRRVLVEKLQTARSSFRPSSERLVVCMSSPFNKQLAYACVFLRKHPSETKEQYRRKAFALMNTYPKAIKLKCPHYKRILCFVCTVSAEAEDMFFSFFDKELSSTDVEQVNLWEKKYGIGANITPVAFCHTPEYPQCPEDLKVTMSKKIPVNAKCPCGSGKKYKKCCGRLY